MTNDLCTHHSNVRERGFTNRGEYAVNVMGIEILKSSEFNNHDIRQELAIT